MKGGVAEEGGRDYASTSMCGGGSLKKKQGMVENEEMLDLGTKIR